MRERINRLAKGIIDTEVPKLILKPSEADESVHSGTITKREIFVTSENNLHIKGLVYSSNARVKPVNQAFGGSRNHVTYEINSNHLDNGDVIKGFLYLVTNGGEVEVPYSFHVELGTSGKLLGGLKEAKDFANLAKNDMDTALRLFEYQDFMEAAFMQDMKVRALYDGLKGRGNRQNLLEEFLVALDAKERVILQISTEDRTFENPLELIEDKIRIVKSGWGYVNIDVKADGDFICLSKKMVASGDFIGNACDYLYQIDPNKLHQGRNFGSITFSGMKQDTLIRIEVAGDETVDISDGETHRKGDLAAYQAGFSRYLSLRLDYESGLYEIDPIQKQMLRELEMMQYRLGKEDVTTLLQAEIYIMTDRTEQACLLLDECRENILASRLDQLEIYCFYQYLHLKTRPDASQKESLIRLVNKYLMDEKVHFYLFFLVLKLDHLLYDSPGALLNQMKSMFQSGCTSPFLYMEVCKIWNGEPEMLRSMDQFELHSLYFGAKRGMISRDLAMVIARLANGAKFFHKLYYRLLVMLYDHYPEKNLLSAICCMLIKGDCRHSRYFKWYKDGLEAGISLTRLYEYLLYSLPDDYTELLPREVLLYFSYDKQLDNHSKSVLYTNLLHYMSTESELFKAYEREIEKFAMGQLFEAHIDSRLAVIYDHMIYRDMIDVPVAKVLPAILRSYRVTCRHKRMRYVIVCHEELMAEDAFVLKDGVAFVPLFSERSILLFQDAYGNRYADIPYKKEPVMDKPDLEKRCFEVLNGHPMLLLKECRRIVEQGVTTETEVDTLETALRDLVIHPLYQKQILAGIIAYFQSQIGTEEGLSESGINYLLYLSKSDMSGEERIQICETLIHQNYIKEAYDIIREYGSEGIGANSLLKLCSKMILNRLFGEEELLLALSEQVFESGQSDAVTLDYLCEHFNGNSEQMYRILLQGVREHIETYDLEERLTAQMMFSGETGKIDKVFDLYATRKKTSESILKAYFTIKSIEYFLEGKPSADKVFDYLEGAVNGTYEKDKVPTLYLLALTQYYSTLPELSEEQSELCKCMVSILLEEGLIFPYFCDLGKLIPMPEDIMDKGMVQYNGSKESKVELLIRILPEEEEYHVEDMRRIYQGIFVKQKILFEGEILEYQIYEIDGCDRVLVKEGSIEGGNGADSDKESRFSYLNQMGLCLNLKEEESLKKRMSEYLIKTATVEELFRTM